MDNTPELQRGLEQTELNGEAEAMIQESLEALGIPAVEDLENLNPEQARLLIGIYADAKSNGPQTSTSDKLNLTRLPRFKFDRYASMNNLTWVHNNLEQFVSAETLEVGLFKDRGKRPVLPENLRKVLQFIIMQAGKNSAQNTYKEVLEGTTTGGLFDFTIDVGGESYPKRFDCKSDHLQAIEDRLNTSVDGNSTEGEQIDAARRLAVVKVLEQAVPVLKGWPELNVYVRLPKALEDFKGFAETLKSDHSNAEALEGIQIAMDTISEIVQGARGADDKVMPSQEIAELKEKLLADIELVDDTSPIQIETRSSVKGAYGAAGRRLGQYRTHKIAEKLGYKEDPKYPWTSAYKFLDARTQDRELARQRSAKEKEEQRRKTHYIQTIEQIDRTLNSWIVNLDSGLPKALADWYRSADAA